MLLWLARKAEDLKHANINVTQTTQEESAGTFPAAAVVATDWTVDDG